MTRRTLRIVRWGIFIAAGTFLYLRLFADQSTQAVWGGMGRALKDAPGWFWPVMVVLIVLNWGLESAKWRWLVGHLEPIGRLRAFAATLTGTAIGLVTPNRTGEFAGRVLFLAPGHRWQGAFATWLGSIAQFVTTVIMGGLALVPWWLMSPGMDAVRPSWGVAMGAVAAMVAAGALSLFFRPGLLRRLLSRVPLLRRLEEPAGVLEGYTAKELAAVLGMSMARYAVFWVQYALFLSVYAGVEGMAGLVVVPVIYLIVTLVPTMLLSELGVRGTVAVALLSPWGVDPGLALLASFGVWGINLALPAVAGSLIMLSARIQARP
ncbi:MAG TPA: lysylphosphatidylglycerol synthase domain-containing protein [Flavobacteriales bacterium]|nr:lysylphosphatidylglycerol synthase domain-containing protein [Flavobacteriales bacterium]